MHRVLLPGRPKFCVRSVSKLSLKSFARTLRPMTPPRALLLLKTPRGIDDSPARCCSLRRPCTASTWLRGPANGAPGPAAPLRPSDHPATPAPEQPLMLNGSARRCRQVELQVIWCRPALGALSLPMVRFSFLGGVTLMIEVTFFCRYARECEISRFFISREIHCEVKCEMSWRFHCKITFPASVRPPTQTHTDFNHVGPPPGGARGKRGQTAFERSHSPPRGE